MEKELTWKQTNRQDKVDNTIFNMLEEILDGFDGRKPQWDIEVIGAIRDIIISQYISEDDEMAFYPYIEMSDEPEKTIADFHVDDFVNVEPTDDDDFSEFRGRVVDFKSKANLVIVIDFDENCWDVHPWQLTLVEE